MSQTAAVPDYGTNPAESGGAHSDLEENVLNFLEREREVGSFPGAVWAAGHASGIEAEGMVGHSVLKPARMRIGIDTIFDVASLTKPLITGTLILRAWADGLLDPGDRASKFLPELRNTEKETITVLDLLTHRGGFQAWYPLYTQGLGKTAYLDAIKRRPLRYRPGTRQIYTCLGFILLIQIAERVFEESIEDLTERLIFQPLGLRNSMFNPSPSLLHRIAATEWGNANERHMVKRRQLSFDDWRETMIWGEVNDGNAFYMGGIGGNAGLFSTAREVFEFGRAWIDGSERLLPSDITDRALRNYTIGLEENRGLAWQLHTPKPDHPTVRLSPRSFGHTGFTGTSIYVDPDRELIMVLLTNRLHPSCKPINTNYIRQKFHGFIINAWD
ncbi:MAG: serine hydrolase [Acidobacteria bacterium]|nr:serine hydrolase [Acidobacteriota bacterium]